MKALPVISLAILALAACGQNEPAPMTESSETANLTEPDRAAQISDGLAIVEANCTSCHAVHTNDESPRTDAPPLRTVLKDLSPEALEDDFREGIHVGAVDMADFDLGPRGTSAVVEYIKSIQTSASAE